MEELPRFGSGIRGLFRFDKKTHQTVPIKEAPKLKSLAPMISTDTIEPIMSHATHEGKIFDSKSAYRRHLRENGFEDTGGEHLKDVRPPKTDEEEMTECVEDVEKAYYDVKYGRVQFTEKEKENHLREERKWGKKYRVRSPY